MKAPAAAYRAHNPIWHRDPTSGAGAAKKGGRFNPKGVAALYLSLRYETAILEASQGFKNKMQPLTIVQYELDFDDVVDLRVPKEQAAWKAPLKLLGSKWEFLASKSKPVPTWDLADRMTSAGVAGIVVPSFAHKATGKDANLVLWKWGRRPPHKCVAVDDEGRLLRLPSK